MSNTPETSPARAMAARALPIVALAGFVSSAFLVAQYALPAAASACGPGGGCNTVRTCWSLLPVLGRVPLPWLGVLVFGAFLGLSLSERPSLRKLIAPAGVGVALGGAALLVVQAAVCHAWCKFCLATDASALVVGALAVLAHGAAFTASRAVRIGAGVVATLSLAIAVLAGGVQSMPHRGPRELPPNEPSVIATLPAPIAEEQRDGVATIVEFADFECPYCRMQHQSLSRVLPSYGARVRFVRRHVPLGRIHVHAEDAARAACCAEEQHHEEDMADALFRTEDLTVPGCEAQARRLGLDMDRYRACVSSPRPNEHIEDDRRRAHESGVSGLPTMFVGHERFDGVVGENELRQSIERALHSSAGALSSASARPST